MNRFDSRGARDAAAPHMVHLPHVLGSLPMTRHPHKFFAKVTAIMPLELHENCSQPVNMERNFGKKWCCTLFGATQMFQLRSDLSGQEGDPFGTQVLQVVAGPSLCKAFPSLSSKGEQGAKHTPRQLGASTRLFPAGVPHEPHIQALALDVAGRCCIFLKSGFVHPWPDLVRLMQLHCTCFTPQLAIGSST